MLADTLSCWTPRIRKVKHIKLWTMIRVLNFKDNAVFLWGRWVCLCAKKTLNLVLPRFLQGPDKKREIILPLLHVSFISLLYLYHLSWAGIHVWNSEGYWWDCAEIVWDEDVRLWFKKIIIIIIIIFAYSMLWPNYMSLFYFFDPVSDVSY